MQIRDDDIMTISVSVTMITSHNFPICWYWEHEAVVFDTFPSFGVIHSFFLPTRQKEMELDLWFVVGATDDESRETLLAKLLFPCVVADIHDKVNVQLSKSFRKSSLHGWTQTKLYYIRDLTHVKIITFTVIKFDMIWTYSLTPLIIKSWSKCFKSFYSIYFCWTPSF